MLPLSAQDLLRRARGWVARRGARDALKNDAGAALPFRFPAVTWVFVILSFLAVYFFVFTVVHPIADTRPCTIVLDDPLHHIVPHDRRWLFLTMTVYVVITLTAAAAVLGQACLGDHRPFLRWALGLAIQGMMRSVTIWLVPLCKATFTPPHVVLTEMPMVTVCGISFPWRPFANNDLLYSGHIGEFLLLSWATRSWPAPVRVFIWFFNGLQFYGLLATRGHYTVDLLVAVPCAFFADRVAVRLLAWSRQNEI